MAHGIDRKTLDAYWKKNIKLTTFTLIIWFVVTYVAAFLPQLNRIVIFGFPFDITWCTGFIDYFCLAYLQLCIQDEQVRQKFGVEEEEENKWQKKRIVIDNLGKSIWRIQVCLSFRCRSWHRGEAGHVK